MREDTVRPDEMRMHKRYRDERPAVKAKEQAIIQKAMADANDRRYVSVLSISVEARR